MKGLAFTLVCAISAMAAPSEEAWTLLDPDQLSPAWTQTVGELSANQLVRAEFVEERRSRLRRRPARFNGDLIYSCERGLSLYYDAMITSTVILDNEGVLRRSLEAERALPVPMEAGGLHEIILLVFALDLTALGEHFAIEEQRDDGSWALRFTPLEGQENSLSVRKVVLEGHAGLVKTIQFLREGGLDLRIFLRNHVLDPSLSPAETEARFR